MADQAKQTRRIRTDTVPVTKEFLDYLHSKWHLVKAGNWPGVDGPVTLEEFGVLLAKKVKRNKPFSKAALSRFFKGDVTSREVLHALCVFFMIPSPTLLPKHIDEVEWFVNGVYLRQRAPEEFEQLLRIVKAKIALANELNSVEKSTAKKKT